MTYSANASNFSCISGGTGSRGAEAGTGLSSGGAVLDTSGVIGTNSILLFVSFSASGLMVETAEGSAADTVAGASVGGGAF
jgi:hypothetical protein